MEHCSQDGKEIYTRLEKNTGAPYTFCLSSKLVDEINNTFFEELENEHLEQELIKELRDIINDYGNVDGLLKIIEKHSK